MALLGVTFILCCQEFQVSPFITDCLLSTMPEITLRLIRSKNPQLNVDNLEDCPILTLDNCGIEEIENLELFTHLTELRLSGNNIAVVENLGLFSKLQYLDVSQNKITSQSLLRSSVPTSLNTLNLSGNPCVCDEDALSAFQDKYPKLFIVVEDVIEESVDEGEQTLDEEDTAVTPIDVSDAIAAIPEDMNSDAVLSYIVNRKLKLQSIDSFNLEASVAVSHTTMGCFVTYRNCQTLNDECSKTLEQREAALNLRRHNHPEQASHIEESSAQIRQRTEAMLERNKEERTKFTEFMTRLKATAAQHKTSIQARAEEEEKAKQASLA